MRNHIFKQSILVACVCAISACGFFDKDNTPQPKSLTSFTPQMHPRLLWKTTAGNGAGGEYLKLSPAMSESAIFTSSSNGDVAAIAKANGHINWRKSTGLMITTGPGAGDGLVVIGSLHGTVMALNQATGNTAWTTSIKGEIIANPAVKNGYVIIKSLDGTVTALSTANGDKLWSFKQSEPDLILRGASAPLIQDGQVIAGFANGNLVSSSLNSGTIQWIQQIAVPEGAFAIERMTDIDADPIINGHRIFAATYQGNIASLNWRSGQTIWSQQLSSYTGMTADDAAVYVSDAKSLIWSFGIESGNIIWKQSALEARNISAPAEYGRYIVVGDAEGYIHWLDKRDGHFAARESLSGGILAKPLVDGHALYLLTNNGTVAAYQINA